MQRHPVMKQTDYSKMYSAGTAAPWRGLVQRNDQKMIADIVLRLDEIESVLDVGAGDGTLLAMLPNHLSKSAIEPSPASQKLLRQQAVAIFSNELSDETRTQGFDCILAVDVIEHFVDPMAFMDSVAKMLVPGGYLVIATGDPTAPVWAKRLKQRFWYSHYQEHLTFPSPAAIFAGAKKNGLSKVSLNNLFYMNLTFAQKAIKWLLQWSYFMSAPLHISAMFILRRGKFGSSWDDYIYASAAGVFKDHYIAVMQKNK
jgi:SAM-dependent methyltransferase